MYRNYEKSALMELERQRTGNYGADYEDEECVGKFSLVHEEAEYGEDDV